MFHKQSSTVTMYGFFLVDTTFLAVLFGEMSMLSGHISAEQLTKYVLTWRVPVLDRVNLSIHPNEVVAIVGPSGGGKSTLTYLLLHLYEPINGQNFSQAHVLVSIEKNYAPFGDFNCLYMNYGDPKQKLPMKLQIYVDGFPLRDLDIQWLREKIGFVEQEPHLFHMDIKSYIKYGCRGNIKQEDIEQAAKLAYAHDFILSLPNGYKTLVDDNLLSGGQKQRIAIARTILRNPSILILDEATSALDSQSEDYGVLHEFKNDIKAKRTVIIIAHRLSTIRNADRIVVMDSGRVIEVGDHAELIRKDGLYSRLS
ncbi:hypothetical protein FEM48_ZijujUnG0099500 [Ziziphus jujuba var. spinosa]|uniref:ABC transporter domain-containing protein n=1 Tax=Ziziphus jujuba var. spinosa TaxID=714518 RepID=A0A978U8A2_ZIZJJ|nr:hypothetical protein FEM48_ZijujUnG0099500 [Ziziphus jujuba var. spinosa]